MSLLDQLNGLAELVLPPLVFLVPLLLALFALRGRGSWRALAWLALAGLWLLSTPLVARWLIEGLAPPFVEYQGDEAEAIVILAGGVVAGAREYGGVGIKHLSLERARYGAYLYRKWKKPILVSGGDPMRYGVPEAVVIRDVLVREFRVPVKWIEVDSLNTHDNARLSAAILKQAGIGRAFLVTHAWHMPRALREFGHQGFDVLPAGIGYQSMDIRVSSFVPSAAALLSSYYACHEWLGMAWYKLKYRILGVSAAG